MTSGATLSLLLEDSGLVTRYLLVFWGEVLFFNPKSLALTGLANLQNALLRGFHRETLLLEVVNIKGRTNENNEKCGRSKESDYDIYVNDTIRQTLTLLDVILRTSI